MSNSDIKLRFINHSNDTNNSSIVIFQQNVAESFGEIAVAWRVIQNCGRLDTHPFTYPMEFQVSAKDSYGNYTPLLTAVDGQAYELNKDTSGDVLSIANTPASSAAEIEVRNSLQLGAMDACCFRDGKLLASKTNIAPGQKAVFQFHPRIYIGVVSQMTESEIMDSAIIKTVNTELNLFGISSADIIMTGGGPGVSSSPFEFNLANINTF